jgi:TolB-like protein
MSPSEMSAARGPASLQYSGLVSENIESTASSTVAGLDPSLEARKLEKRKKKARAAWISFAGRIVAQVVGAAASIILGLHVVGKYARSENQVGTVSAPHAASGSAAGPRALHSSHASLAVLPLQNFSGDPKHDYFADGLTEVVITELAAVHGLRVISRTSSMYFKGQQRVLPAIAQELGVDLILEGSVTRAGDRVRVTAQLIDAARDEHLWAKTYDRRVRDVLALQAEMAAAIVSEVRDALIAASVLERPPVQTANAVSP